nr:hypothetical protein [Streptomyces monomycini]
MRQDETWGEETARSHDTLSAGMFAPEELAPTVGHLAGLDLLAHLAGSELESRRAGWKGAGFTAESKSHVSVYRLGEAA